MGPATSRRGPIPLGRRRIATILIKVALRLLKVESIECVSTHVSFGGYQGAKLVLALWHCWDSATQRDTRQQQ